MNKNKVTLVGIILAVVSCLASCDGKKSQTVATVEQQPTAQQSTAQQSTAQQPTAQQPTINKEWQYLEQIDKLNGIKNYEAKVLSIDGKIECSISAIDLTGRGNYTSILAITWYDDAIPACYDKILMGMKFPNDSQWRKIPIKCKGRSGALVDDLKYMDELRLLKSCSQFSILFANEEYIFKPSKPLKWKH